MGSATESNIGEYQAKTDALYSGLNSLKGGKMSPGKADTYKSGFSDSKVSGWTDDVGVAFNKNVESAVEAMETVAGSISGGSFNQLCSCAWRMKEYADEVVRLIDLRDSAQRSLNNLNKDAENYKTRKNYYEGQISHYNTHIKGNLDCFNGDMAKLPGFHFEGSGVTSDAGGDAGGGADTGEDTSAQDAAAAKRAEVEANFDRDSLSDHMPQLFDIGLDTMVPVTYGDETVFIQKVGDNQYAICDYNGTPLSDARFTHDQVTASEATYVDGHATYPAVEEACIDYFASK